MLELADAPKPQQKLDGESLLKLFATRVVGLSVTQFSSIFLATLVRAPIHGGPRR